jgi:geranylgeranyl pyrophosphate synthase
VDDVLDLRETSESIGKPAGSDLRQGTLTLPMMLYMERYADADDLELIQKVVVGTKTDDTQIDALVGRVRTSGALDDAIAEAQAAVDHAKRELEILPAGEPRDYLAAMADFVTERRT